MTNRLLTTLPAAALLAAGVAACGSSKAPGIVPVPSGGATVAAVTTPSTPTTPSTTTPSTTTPTTPSASTPTSGPLSKEPKIVVPKAKPPKALTSKDVVKGTGAVAGPDSTVVVNYVGALYSNGKVFDASWVRHTPFTAALGPTPDVIEGWAKGIPGMKVGGRRELIIPPSLAYKAAGQGSIPPNATLVFIIDLLAVSK
jgi:peptidylprolyl isomerase